MRMSSVGSDTILPKPGQKISKETLAAFEQRIHELGFKFSSQGVCGGFDGYCGSEKVLDELVQDLASIKNDILPKTKVKDIVLKYEDLKNTDDFAVTRGKTIVLNKRIYDDSAFLAKKYSEAVDEKLFVKGTDYRVIPFHEVGHVISKRQPNIVRLTEKEVLKFAMDDRMNLNQFVSTHISNYALVYYKNSKVELLPELISGSHSKDEITQKLCKDILGGVLL